MSSKLSGTRSPILIASNLITGKHPPADVPCASSGRWTAAGVTAGHAARHDHHRPRHEGFFSGSLKHVNRRGSSPFPASPRYVLQAGETYHAGGSRRNIAQLLSRVGRHRDALDWAHAALRDFHTIGASASEDINDAERLIQAIQEAIDTGR